MRVVAAGQTQLLIALVDVLSEWLRATKVDERRPRRHSNGRPLPYRLARPWGSHQSISGPLGTSPDRDQ